MFYSWCSQIYLKTDNFGGVNVIGSNNDIKDSTKIFVGANSIINCIKAVETRDMNWNHGIVSENREFVRFCTENKIFYRNFTT